MRPSTGVAKLDEEPTLRWSPVGNLTIKFVGFAQPVGENEEIGIPKDAGEGDWTASNRNTAKNLFSYTVFAETNDGRIISTDPQIENEGKSGDEEENGDGRG